MTDDHDDKQLGTGAATVAGVSVERLPNGKYAALCRAIAADGSIAAPVTIATGTEPDVEQAARAHVERGRSQLPGTKRNLRYSSRPARRGNATTVAGRDRRRNHADD